VATNVSSARIRSFFPIYNTGGAISYIAGSIVGSMHRQGVNARLFVPASAREARRPYIREAVPLPLNGAAYRLAGERRTLSFAERQYARSLRPGDVAYLWPGHGENLTRRVKDRGATLVLERINCCVGLAREVLDREMDAVGLPRCHGITDESTACETAYLNEADFIFSPSPMVDFSLEVVGLPKSKVLSASYGWGSERITPNPDRPARAGPLRVLFVGSLCHRKGVHRLLEAWRLANLPGELLLAGRVFPEVAAHHGQALERPNIRKLGHVKDIGLIYQDADVFAFPTFEEGSPLVTYEAMASGLPVVVSPMGAGGVAREGDGAFVLPPDQPELWAEALRKLAAEPDLRREMGRKAALRAGEFTWEKCAAHRYLLLSAALAAKSNGRAG
jgi:glycosyltransferase involved in cell wall biosynthesis